MKTLRDDVLDIFAKPFLKVDILKLVKQTVKEHDRDIKDLQKEQISSGISEDGTEFQPPYTPETIRRKKIKGQQTEFVNLQDTGAFKRNIYAKFNPDDFEISSRSTKTTKLVDKYFGRQGGDIFGLTEENMEYLGQLILPLLQQNFKLLFS